MKDATKRFAAALESGKTAAIPTAQRLAAVVWAAQEAGSATGLRATLDLVKVSAMVGILYQLEEINRMPRRDR